MHVDTFTIHVARKTLSQLLAQVEAGEEIVPARGKRPIAKRVPCRPVGFRRQFGALRHVVSGGPEFFSPLPANEPAV
jgi:antitoxin (DNA-binding transcriptional repressor) of toxin-antitoxin stability system